MTDNLVKMARERANAGGYYSEKWDMLADRIEQLEAALAKIAQHDMQAIAMDALRPGERIRKALEGKDD